MNDVAIIYIEYKNKERGGKKIKWNEFLHAPPDREADNAVITVHV